MNCKVTVRAKVNPTEELDKVIRAISNIFDYEELEIGDGYVEVTGDENSVLKLKEELKNRKIRDTANKMLFKGIENNKISFSLGKQAALVSVPNFVDSKMSALGELDVEIETDNPEVFIAWITHKEEDEE
ncbi:protein of unknown function DUF54 [Methanobacterium lacus]|uniref:UPF0201 protein Metbo_1162 n=1 Tax=Methanobacterium lacus (strain AL-21) TaxID=877455 RepID=F0T691_METLA|nr:RNA-binding domain-containing protein [Methanobacterium lacus]ADZ09406.1 protein of unknown function DUF54 [Methanobacterium lacus]